MRKGENFFKLYFNLIKFDSLLTLVAPIFKYLYNGKKTWTQLLQNPLY